MNCLINLIVETLWTEWNMVPGMRLKLRVSSCPSGSPNPGHDRCCRFFVTPEKIVPIAQTDTDTAVSLSDSDGHLLVIAWRFAKADNSKHNSELWSSYRITLFTTPVSLLKAALQTWQNQEGNDVSVVKQRQSKRPKGALLLHSFQFTRIAVRLMANNLSGP